MARNDDSQPRRVYKASDVHKRRVDRKGRSKGQAAEPEVAAPSSPRQAPAHEPPVQHDAHERPAQAQDAQQAVVIAPEFGRRSQAQREADERWFAAMREADPLATASIAPVGDGEAQGASADDAAMQHGEPGEGAKAQPEAAEAGPPAAQGGRTPDASEGESPDDASHHAEEQPDVQEGDEPEAVEGAASSRPTARRSAHRPAIFAKRSFRIAVAVVAVLLVAAIVAASAFSWNRWYRYDDHADMQGTWYVVGTTVPVSVSEGSIQLTDTVAYAYEINPHDKTISYSLGKMQGQGRYWFSDDRQYLVITDGDEFTGASTAVDDLLHAFADAADNTIGDGAKLPEGEGIIAFSREPDAAALKREQEEAAKKAAEEAAARQEAERIAAEEQAAWEAYYYGEDDGEAYYGEAYDEEAYDEGEAAADMPDEGAPIEEVPVEGEPAGEASVDEAA